MPTTTDTQQYTPYGLPPSAVNYMAYIDNAYSADDSETQKLKELLVTHSLQVARKALEIAHTHALPLADGDIVAAAMLHDIGIIATNAPGIHCHGTEHYLRHGVLGAAMLRKAGAPRMACPSGRKAHRHRYHSQRHCRISPSHASGRLYAGDIARTPRMLCRQVLQQKPSASRKDSGTGASFRRSFRSG